MQDAQTLLKQFRLNPDKPQANPRLLNLLDVATALELTIHYFDGVDTILVRKFNDPALYQLQMYKGLHVEIMRFARGNRLCRLTDFVGVRIRPPDTSRRPMLAWQLLMPRA